MLPFLEKRPQTPSVLDYDADGVDGARDRDLHELALEAVAGNILTAIKSDSREGLAEAIKLLCELCSS